MEQTQGMQGSLCACTLTGLTPAGVLHSWVLGSAVYSAFGPGGYLLVCLYYLLGSAVRMHAVHGPRPRCRQLGMRH